MEKQIYDYKKTLGVIEDKLEELEFTLEDYEELKELKEKLHHREISPLEYLTLIGDFALTSNMQKEYLENKYDGEYEISEISFSEDICLYDKSLFRENSFEDKNKVKIAHHENVKPVQYDINNFIHAIKNGEITFVGDKIIVTSKDVYIFPIRLTIPDPTFNHYHAILKITEEIYDEDFILFIKERYAEPFINSKSNKMYQKLTQNQIDLTNQLNDFIEFSHETKKYIRSLKIERSTKK